MASTPTIRNPALAGSISLFQKQFQSVIQNVEKVILGKQDVIFKVLLVMTAKGVTAISL